MIVYKAKNLINGKLYVGKTVRGLKVRQWSHICSARRGGKSAFYNAIRKYGKENFEFSVLEDCSLGCDLNERERFYIVQYDCLSPKGYNLTPGGDGHPKGWKSPTKGTHFHTEETKRIIKEKRALQVCTEETRKKMSKTRKGRSTSLLGRPSPKKGKSSGFPAWNKGLKGFMKGKIPWNKGLTKESHPSIKSQSEKKIGKTAWNKGLTKETDLRVAMCAEIHKKSDSPGVFREGQIPWNLGIPTVHTEESNRKRSEKMKGIPKSQETIRKRLITRSENRQAKRLAA